MTTISELPQPLKILHGCGGFYQCPKDEDGKRLGPLVGYAGRDDKGKQKVGDVYANWAAAEQHPHQYQALAKLLFPKIHQKTNPDDQPFSTPKNFAFCGMPMGGLSLANLLTLQSSSITCRYIYMEKKTSALATDTAREQSTLVWGRHCAKPDEEVIIVEDVCNNFSTASQAINLIREAGAEVAAIACLLNRSADFEHMFISSHLGASTPVISLVYLPFDQWTQDDPAVAQDIAAGNVVLRPKNKTNWANLMAAMNKGISQVS